MISIAICSVNNYLLQQVKDNIAKTIGIPYEVLVWDNSQTNWGLCKVYNHLAKTAQYELILFLHEDVLFETMHWGGLVTAWFDQMPEAGMVGLAGSSIKSKYASGWYVGDADFDRFSIVHRTHGVDHLQEQRGPHPEAFSQVVTLDGVFLCVRKKIWEQVRFDETVLKGFHFYDIDFSLRVSQIASVWVTFQIKLIHITLGGDYGDRWMKEAFLFHTTEIGRTSFDIPGRTKIKDARKFAKPWLDKLKSEPISFSNRIRWVLLHELWKSPAMYYDILKFLLYKITGAHRLHAMFKRISKK